MFHFVSMPLRSDYISFRNPRVGDWGLGVGGGGSGVQSH